MVQIVYEQLPIKESQSYIYGIHRLPYHDEIPYHEHPEFELTLVACGNGQRITDQHIEPFVQGEIVLVPPNLPHAWVFNPSLCNENGIVETDTWQFSMDFLTKLASGFPEFHPMVAFFQDLRQAIQVNGTAGKKALKMLQRFGDNSEADRLINLWKILNLIYQSGEYRFIGTRLFSGHLVHKDKRRINSVYRYIVENYHRKISLDEIANVALMSKSTFCAFFKKATQKTFTEFLASFRIQMACTLMRRTDMTISEISYSVGFYDVPFFNRTFKRLMGMSPTAYAKSHQSTLF